MYPFEPIRPAWEALWAAVHERARWTPATVVWADDVQARWRDPACVVGHACGWPVAGELRDRLHVVGAFSLALADADGHRYRSVIVADDERSLDARVLADTVAAASSDDSLSGWISLGVASTGAGTGWPGAIRWTGAHVDSVRAVRAGEADLASIDALSWEHISRCHPELVDGLHIIGRGPWVPSPPIVTPVSTPTARVEELRRAFTAAMADPSTAAARRELLLNGFVALDHTEYEPLLQLTGAR